MESSYLIQITGSTISSSLIDKIREFALKEPNADLTIVFYNNSQKIEENGSLKYRTHNVKSSQAETYINELIRNSNRSS